MNPWRMSGLALLLATVPASVAVAGTQSHAISFHFSTPQPAGCPTFNDGVISSCDVIRPNGVTHPSAQWAWVVLSGVHDGTGPGNAGGIGSVSFGLEHSLVSPIWDLCAGATAKADPGWPASGTGITISWDDDCYLVENNAIGATALGILTIDAQATGLIQASAHPGLGRATTTDCAGTELTICPNLLGNGDAMAGGSSGMPACGLTCTTPVEESSWARIKSGFER